MIMGNGVSWFQWKNREGGEDFERMNKQTKTAVGPSITFAPSFSLLKGKKKGNEQLLSTAPWGEIEGDVVCASVSLSSGRPSMAMSQLQEDVLGSDHLHGKPSWQESPSLSVDGKLDHCAGPNRLLRLPTRPS